MVQGKKTPKNKRSFEEKSAIVMNAINADMRRVEVILPGGHWTKYGKQYSMGELARISGYSRSSRFMLFLYEMVDRGMLAKVEWDGAHGVVGKGICAVNIFFMLPQFHPKNTMKSIFTGDAGNG